MKPILNSQKVALMFSGGTDSTLAAVKAAETHQEVHLLTYKRFGMVDVENSEVHANALMNRFPGKFVRPPIANVDKLFKYVSYDHYFRDMLNHRGMLLTTCGLCKLAMHLRTLVYCLENNVGEVYDGANKNMTIFPMQMEEVLEELRTLYRQAGITYGNPVYDYEDDQGIDFGSAVWGLNPKRGEQKGKTTGDELFELGILPSRDIKGTSYDKQIQGRCYQFVLFNLYVRWGALERKSMDEYKERVLSYYTQKIGRARDLVREHIDSPQNSKLSQMVEE